MLHRGEGGCDGTDVLLHRCPLAARPRSRLPPPGANHRGRPRCAAGGRQIVRRSASTPVVTSPVRVQFFMPAVLGRMLCLSAESAQHIQ